MGLYTILSPASTEHHGRLVRTRLQLHTRQFEVIISLPHRLLIGRVYFKNDGCLWPHADDSAVGGRTRDPLGSQNVSFIKPPWLVLRSGCMLCDLDSLSAISGSGTFSIHFLFISSQHHRTECIKRVLISS